MKDRYDCILVLKKENLSYLFGYFLVCLFINVPSHKVMRIDFRLQMEFEPEFCSTQVHRVHGRVLEPFTFFTK